MMAIAIEHTNFTVKAKCENGHVVQVHQAIACQNNGSFDELRQLQTEQKLPTIPAATCPDCPSG